MPRPENVIAGNILSIAPLFTCQPQASKAGSERVGDFYRKNVGTLAKDFKYLPLSETAYQWRRSASHHENRNRLGGVPECLISKEI